MNHKIISCLTLLLFSSFSHSNYYDETLFSEWGQKFSIDHEYLHEKTEFQDLLIFENKVFGKVFALDGIIQLTEKDEYIYSEMFAHVPLMSHHSPKKVLIIGGGDGCVLREILKHPEVESVTLHEIDMQVIRDSQKYFPELNLSAFNNPKTTVHIGETLEYLAEGKNRFDVILCDSTDDVGPGAVLFTKDFYKLCYENLKPQGIFVNMNGVPFLQKDTFVNAHKLRDKIFDSSTYYFVAVPSYIGGLMAIGYSTKDNLQLDIENIRSRYEKLEQQTSYYTPDLHLGSFASPKIFQKMLSE